MIQLARFLRSSNLCQLQAHIFGEPPPQGCWYFGETWWNRVSSFILKVVSICPSFQTGCIYPRLASNHYVTEGGTEFLTLLPPPLSQDHRCAAMFAVPLFRYLLKSWYGRGKTPRPAERGIYKTEFTGWRRSGLLCWDLVWNKYLVNFCRSTPSSSGQIVPHHSMLEKVLPQHLS